jgi:hypothetical protein
MDLLDLQQLLACTAAKAACGLTEYGGEPYDTVRTAQGPTSIHAACLHLELRIRPASLNFSCHSYDNPYLQRQFTCDKHRHRKCVQFALRLESCYFDMCSKTAESNFSRAYGQQWHLACARRCPHCGTCRCTVSEQRRCSCSELSRLCAPPRKPAGIHDGVQGLLVSCSKGTGSDLSEVCVGSRMG